MRPAVFERRFSHFFSTTLPLPAILEQTADSATTSLPPSQSAHRQHGFHRSCKEPPKAAESARFEGWLCSLGIGTTVFSTFAFIIESSGTLTTEWERGEWGRIGSGVVFAGLVVLLVWGNLVYQLCRRAYFKRLQAHRPPNLDEIRQRFDRGAPVAPPAVTILVPTYREEIRVLRQSLLSAALQCYPNRRVVLLIDDSPSPHHASDRRKLEETRRLPAVIERQLEPMRELTTRALATAAEEHDSGIFSLAQHHDELCRLYRATADWFESCAEQYQVDDHSDEQFVQLTFVEPALHLRMERERLLERFLHDPASHTPAVLLAHYARLAAVFDVSITCFERKRYQNLSHEPNKAMNLNSYISLIGSRVEEVWRGESLFIEDSTTAAAVSIPDSEYIVTLDADSVLAPDYVLRLVDVMERPGSERLAVLQTPYSAFPNPSSTLERIAGATTDIQYIVHQGFSGYGATFWVGANALLRRSALEDIATETEERGFSVRRFIQDRTVIEDTESSIDLRANGWELLNYPERLSYSATPPDFGSLLVQRRRWANGGLIIFPKLCRSTLHSVYDRPWSAVSRLTEFFFRSHYLVSLAVSTFALIYLLLAPLPAELSTVWIPLTALPYFCFYYRDLRQAGYARGDLLRVYALNFALLPVHLAGVLKSLEQAITGKQIPFHRTPKVSERTCVPAPYLGAELLLMVSLIAFGAIDLSHFQIGRGLLGIVNGSVFLYVCLAFIAEPKRRTPLEKGRAARPSPAAEVSPVETATPIQEAARA